MSNSKFKVEFTLKQHTPIIHFQSDQVGATLRASELKPKFDGFLKKVAFNDEFEEYKTFLIGYDENKSQTKKDFDGKEAFNYKVTIINQNLNYQTITKQIKKYNKKEKIEKIENEGFPTFFATMGNEWKNSPKLFSYTNEIKIYVITQNTNLLNKIKENFANFIFQTNFGTRQSKGFGSFSVIKIDNKPFETIFNYPNFLINLNSINPKVFPHVKYLEEPDNYYLMQKRLFSVIEIFYKTLRSGINLSFGEKFYFKSLIFAFAKSKNITWDKKYFKKEFLGNENNSILKQREDHNNPDILNFKDDNNQVFLVRDLMGLATTQEWMSYKLRVRHPKEKDRFNGQIINENNVKRFKSPLIIKPIQLNDNQFQIYLILNDINKNIFNEKITLLNTYDEGFGKNKKEIISNQIHNLSFWNDFTLESFFDYITNTVDINKHVNIKFHQHPYFKLIIDIYTQLKDSK